MPQSNPIGNRTKSITIIALVLLASMACNPRVIKTIIEEEPDIIASGGSKDENGCLSSGGYQWSVALEKCIRLWEEGIELKNMRAPDSNFVAYLIIDPEKEKVELYLQAVDGGLILSKIGAEWVDSDKRYILTRNTSNQYQVRDAQGSLLYQSNL